MDKNIMFGKLYTEYRTIRYNWTKELNALLKALNLQADTQRKHTELQETVKLWELLAVSAETHKEGRINGSNAEKRKAQATLFLSDLREQDPSFDEACSLLQSTSLRLGELDINITMIKGKISQLRNLSRVCAGLTNALAG